MFELWFATLPRWKRRAYKVISAACGNSIALRIVGYYRWLKRYI